MVMLPEGRVMVDLTGSTRLNWRALPSFCSIEYFDVSSLVLVGPGVTWMRCSHLMFRLPSQPGMMKRSG